MAPQKYTRCSGSQTKSTTLWKPQHLQAQKQNNTWSMRLAWWGASIATTSCSASKLTTSQIASGLFSKSWRRVSWRQLSRTCEEGTLNNFASMLSTALHKESRLCTTNRSRTVISSPTMCSLSTRVRLSWQTSVSHRPIRINIYEAVILAETVRIRVAHGPPLRSSLKIYSDLPSTRK